LYDGGIKLRAGFMGKLLQFRSRQTEADKLLEEVREALQSFDGDQEDRSRFVRQVIRRCGKLKLGDGDPVIAQLDSMLEGFVEQQ
jgi:hypothetical protein